MTTRTKITQGTIDAAFRAPPLAAYGMGRSNQPSSLDLPEDDPAHMDVETSRVPVHYHCQWLAGREPFCADLTEGCRKHPGWIAVD